MENIALWKRALADFSGVFLLASIGLMAVATAITTGTVTLYGLFDLSIVFALAIMAIARKPNYCETCCRVHRKRRVRLSKATRVNVTATRCRVL